MSSMYIYQQPRNIYLSIYQMYISFSISLYLSTYSIYIILINLLGIENSTACELLQFFFLLQSAAMYEVKVGVKAELRSYQQAGINWLGFLNRYKLHGVLCDDMGLGIIHCCIVFLSINLSRFCNIYFLCYLFNVSISIYLRMYQL